MVGLAIVPFLGQLVKSTLPHNEVVLYYLLFLCNSVVSYFVMFKVTLLRADQKEYIRNIVATICLLLQYHCLCGSFFDSTGNARYSCPIITTAYGNFGLDCFCGSSANCFSSRKNL